MPFERLVQDIALTVRRQLAQKNPQTDLPDLARTLLNLGLLDRDQLSLWVPLRSSGGICLGRRMHCATSFALPCRGGSGIRVDEHASLTTPCKCCVSITGRWWTGRRRRGTSAPFMIVPFSLVLLSVSRWCRRAFPGRRSEFPFSGRLVLLANGRPFLFVLLCGPFLFLCSFFQPLQVTGGRDYKEL